MIPSRLRRLVLAVTFSLSAATASAAPITIDFEGLSDLEELSSQFPGLFFSNAWVLTAGTTLNEFDFPPHSGSNVISDNGGPITINFAQQVYSLSGYFTYAMPVTLTAFDSDNNVIGTLISALSNNYLSSDTPSANELLAFNSLVGISSITLTGDSFGGSFVLDDFTYDNEPQQVPEPGTLGLMILAGGMALASRKRRPVDKSIGHD